MTASATLSTAARLSHAVAGVVPALSMTVPARAGAFVGDQVTADSDRSRLVTAGPSLLERRYARIGLRDVNLPVRVLPAQTPRRPNLCLNTRRVGYPKPSANSSEPSYGDCLWAAVDGVPWEGEYEWCNDYRDPAVPWYQVSFEQPTVIGEVRVWTRRDYPLSDFDLLCEPTPGSWQTLAEIRGNVDELRELLFPPVRALAIRVVAHRGPAHQPTIRRITELEAFAPRSSPPARPSVFAYRVKVPRGRPSYVEVREAYGEGETLHETDYAVEIAGRPVFQRRYRCDGPGPVSYAFPVAALDITEAELCFRDTSGQGLAITRVRVIEDPVGQAQGRRLLHPLVVAPRIALSGDADRVLGGWVAAAKPAAAFVQPGLLAEVGYANPDDAAVRQRIRDFGALAARYRVPWVLQLSSWWADTPLHVPDGEGGTFGDVRYQQIGFSQYDHYDDPELREFMESVRPGSYDVRYGLTVPNLWSSTPWLTMNNRRLNEYRLKRLRSAIDAVNELLTAPEGELLQGLVTDDEPMYWAAIADWMSEGFARVNGGVRRTDLLLDLNPAVVADAAADGVRLDPRQGLDRTQRLWLHENAARYEAMVCGAVRGALHSRPPGAALPPLGERIFNYVLARPCYPLDDFGHPAWETGVVPGAAIGLEAGDGRYFERARDLGPLANSDFECGNPSSETTAAWEPQFRAWYDVGCEFVQLCNPGPPENWQGLFEGIGRWSRDDRITRRALSALIQEAATDEWQQATYRNRFERPTTP